MSYWLIPWFLGHLCHTVFARIGITHESLGISTQVKFKANLIFIRDILLDAYHHITYLATKNIAVDSIASYFQPALTIFSLTQKGYSTIQPHHPASLPTALQHLLLSHCWTCWGDILVPRSLSSLSSTVLLLEEHLATITETNVRPNSSLKYIMSKQANCIQAETKHLKQAQFIHFNIKNKSCSDST